MKRFFSILPFLVMLLAACGQAPSTTDNIHFGEKITEVDAQSFTSVMTTLKSSDSFETKVIGTVQKVCKKKGCWVTLMDEGSDESMFVKFKDYGFFLPLDCENQKVIMQGKAFTEVTPVDELRHYAEDEGKSAEEIAAITEPKVEYKFLASGVKFIN